ncbi:MAG: DUF58 domain-containing protein [Planctomycetota bacterium]
MISPTARAVAIAAAGIPVSLLPALIEDSLWIAWPLFLSLLLLACGFDALVLLGEGRPNIDVYGKTELFIGHETLLHASIRLPRLRLRRQAECLAELHDDLRPDTIHDIALSPEGPTECDIPIVPLRRGNLELKALWLRWPGPLGLMRRIVRTERRHEIAVVPDVSGVRSLGLSFVGERQDSTGLRVERFAGDGSEFDALREFLPGLDSRSIDWKASARHRSLLVRQHRAERDHSILIAFDTGQLMGEHLLGQPRLDHAIRAGLTLAYVGLKTGDRVGSAAFGARLEDYVEPRRGLSQFGRIRQHSAAIAYGQSQTNFLLAMTQLGARLPRRSLVVVFTDFTDSITAEIMVERLEHLARRHLVLFVALQDPRPAEIASLEPKNLLTLDRAVLAADIVRDRETVLLRLRRNGVHCVDARPEQATANLIQRYLEIKRREMV